MMTVTENAQALVDGLVSDAGLPEGGGVRLDAGEGQGQLQASLVPGPQEGDQVASDAGAAKVYLSSQAAVALDDLALDATQTPEGVSFTLTPQQQG